MKINKNTPKLWDSLWKPTSFKEDMEIVNKEKKSLRWKKIEKIILNTFGGFNKLKVIEIGSGIGTNALLFALKGAEVSVLDYSENALKRCKIFFERNNTKVNIIKADALNLDKKLLNSFDVSMSFGLAEHFLGKKREEIINAHIKLLKDNGISFIAVPNKLNIFYRVWKFLSQLFKRWRFGEEYPFSRNELRTLAKKAHATATFFGDSFIDSFRFVNPLRRFLKKDRKEIASFLDDYFGYCLVLVSRKNNQEKVY